MSGTSWPRCIMPVMVLSIGCGYMIMAINSFLSSVSTPESLKHTFHRIDHVVPFISTDSGTNKYDRGYDDDGNVKGRDDDDNLYVTNKHDEKEDNDLREPSKGKGIHVPVLQSTDLIYKTARWGNPLVIKEYKLVFFTIPKVACTEWKLLFRRMLGLPEWPEDVPLINLHDPTKNKLPYISNFSLEEAQEMLTSDEWTRAVFVREPKERVLSAFLNKFVEEEQFFLGKCCQLRNVIHTTQREYCIQKRKERDFVYFLNRTLDCRNPHWTPQVEAVDEKWWGQMTFVGYMSQVADDAERLLKSIHHSSTGTSAWEDFGKTGWGINGTSAFMVRDTAHHATNAHDRLKRIYTPCTEKFVEKHWAKDWNHHVIHFDTFHLFDEKDYKNNSRECLII